MYVVMVSTSVCMYVCVVMVSTSVCMHVSSDGVNIGVHVCGDAYLHDAVSPEPTSYKNPREPQEGQFADERLA